MANRIVSGYLVLRASSLESLSEAALSSVRSSLVKAFGLQVSNDEELSELVQCSVITNNKASLLASVSNFVRVRFTASVPSESDRLSSSFLSSSSPKPKLVSVVLEDGPQTAAVYYTYCGIKADASENTPADNSAVISVFDREEQKRQEVYDAYVKGRLCSHSAQIPLILATKRLLVVGAGGIGCELVKALVLLGFRSIVLVDLDTIDATNLNRQFLFRKRHVGMPKAEVVAEAVGEWYKDWSSFLHSKITAAGCGEGLPTIEAYYKSLVGTPLTIKPICGNIKNADGPFDLDFFQSFDLVLNGLDNVSARKHVNRMCMQAGVRLVESGTAGYNGQVQPIVRGKTSCYDCVERPPDQKSFAVCTIHARPTTMVHCVHYAKELYERLFGVNSQQQLQQQHKDSEDSASAEGAAGAAAAASDEMQFLADIAASGTLATPEGANALLSLLFVKKIEELLAMKAASTWTNGSPPVPLREAMSAMGVIPLSGGKGNKGDEDCNNHDNDEAAATTTGADAAALVGKEETIIKPADDFKVPSVEEAIVLAKIAIQEAGMRCNSPEGARSGFKKEDPIAVRFVTAMANLRASCFHIARDSLHELTTVAGSIVPAIATTNAIIASCVANIAQLMLSSSSSSSPSGKDGEENVDDNTNNHADDATTYPFVYVRKAPQTRRRRIQLSSSSSSPTSSSVLTVRDELLIHSVPPPEPNPKCLICSADAARVITCRLNSELYTLEEFIKIILRDRMSLVAPTLSVGPSIIYEHDEFESLAKQSLSRWVGVGGGATAFVVGDLFQTVEWTMMVYNEGPEAPFYRSDVMHFCLDGTEATGEEERRLGGRGVNLPPPSPTVAANAQQIGSNNVTSAKAVDTPASVLLSSTSVSTSAPAAFIVGAKHDRNGHSISSGGCGEEKGAEEGLNKEKGTVAVDGSQGTCHTSHIAVDDAKTQEQNVPLQGVGDGNHANADDDDLMVVDGPSNGAKGDKRHKAEPRVVAESNTHTMPTVEAKSAVDTDDDVIEIE